MLEQINDSLDLIARRMEIEDRLIERIRADPSLSRDRKDEQVRQVEAWAESTSDDDLPDLDLDDDDSIAILVRKLGPRGPFGKSGAAAVRPETET